MSDIKTCEECDEKYCSFCDPDIAGKFCSEKCYSKNKLAELDEKMDRIFDKSK